MHILPRVKRRLAWIKRLASWPTLPDTAVTRENRSSRPWELDNHNLILITKIVIYVYCIWSIKFQVMVRNISGAHLVSLFNSKGLIHCRRSPGDSFKFPDFTKNLVRSSKIAAMSYKYMTYDLESGEHRDFATKFAWLFGLFSHVNRLRWHIEMTNQIVGWAPVEIFITNSEWELSEFSFWEDKKEDTKLDSGTCILSNIYFNKSKRQTSLIK